MGFKLLLFSMCIAFSSLAGALDLSSFTLTELQKNMLLGWHAEERFSTEKLLSFAQAYHNYNTRPPVYIPPHTPQDIQDVTAWAEGRAFVFFAKFAGVPFDANLYEQDCPHPALFNFGLATEKTYLRHDVLEKAFRTMDLLAFHYQRSPEKFQEIYLQLAEEKGFGIYVREPVQLALTQTSH